MENKLPFIYRTFFISIVSALSIFIIPIPITIFLLIKHYKLIKEQQILIEPILETYNSIELAIRDRFSVEGLLNLLATILLSVGCGTLVLRAISETLPSKK